MRLGQHEADGIEERDSVRAEVSAGAAFEFYLRSLHLRRHRGSAGEGLHCRMSDGSKASLRALVRSVSACTSPGWQSRQRLLPQASYTKQLQTKREALVFASLLYFSFNIAFAEFF